ncbi:flagellar basal-body MS-ring/collar protein FliF [Kordiimonas aquimaris]|uniref:flagellar basal-body MS-ring/collar protein FliF n=1 Tax=Kordiimonas aquimaris TaxID=707591 RepID=UPI0021D2ECB3|nr:flagellar basal-body MS-ring/collar protein FliF [Kordiimonas aquimaris]
MDGLLQFIRNLGTGRLLLISLVGVGTLAFFFTVIGGIQNAPMTPLYTDLDPADAASIAQRLENDGIPYETAAGGRIVRVPQDQVDRLRLLLAGDGLSGGVIGKEIFDQESSFGRTSFELNVNYVRAVEGELSRTIKFIRSVSEARVHIVMPERRPFQREESQPSASILLKTSGALGQGQAIAIQSLVASAVPGLSPDRVTISDTNGRLLIDGAAEGDFSSLSSLEDARLAKERQYREKIEQLLARRVGDGRVRAEVSIDMDMNRTTTSQTTYDPDGQVILSSNLREENSSEANENGGQVTIGNNLPDAAGNLNNNNNTSNTTEETTNFENSKVETVTVKEPGDVTQIRISVLVDGIRTLDATGVTTAYQDRAADEIEQLRALVESAVPFDAARNDSIVVQSLRFVDPVPFGESQAGFSLFGLNKQDLIDVLTTGGTFVAIILVLLLVVRPLVVRLIEAIPDAPPPVDPTAQIENNAAAAPAIAGPVQVTPEILAAAAGGDANAAALVVAAKEAGTFNPNQMQTDTRIDVAQVEGRVQESALKKVADIIKSNPDESVSIVRQWLYAEQ